MECDNGYDIRKHIKDNKFLANNENRGKEPIVQPQRSSSSPTSNIWLRLIEDEENIGNVDSFFFFFSGPILRRHCTKSFINISVQYYLTHPDLHYPQNHAHGPTIHLLHFVSYTSTLDQEQNL